MNYYKKILNILLSVGILVSINFSQPKPLSVDLLLLNTGWFTYNSWANNSGLWTVNIENKTDVEQQYRIYYQLKGGDEIKTSGLSPVEFIQGNSGKEIYNNDNVYPFHP